MIFIALFSVWYNFRSDSRSEIDTRLVSASGAILERSGICCWSSVLKRNNIAKVRYASQIPNVGILALAYAVDIRVAAS